MTHRHPYRWLGRAVVVAIGLAATGASAHTGTEAGVVSIVKVKTGGDKAELVRLKNQGFDIAGVNLKAGTVDVIVHNSQESYALKFQGFTVVTSKTVDTRLAPDSEYKTPEKIDELVHGLAKQYPALVHVESIGKSLEGRDIWAMKISTTPDSRDPAKPAVLFNAMHHAREVMSPEVVLDTADYLLTKYGHDAKVTKWVDHNDIWLLPMVNPDGNHKVWTEDSMWRKNVRGGYGVDINRNYPYAWNSCNGSSSMTFADDYHGPSAGSEPETQVMMAFVNRIQPVFDISYHSYSELVIYPYGCNGVRSETKDVIEPLGKQMAALVPSEGGSGNYTPGTAWETLYDVDGDDVDWMYHAQHVIPYVIEVQSDSSGFQPPFSSRQGLVESLRPAWQLLLDKLDQSGVRGVVTDGSGRAQPTAIVSAKSAGKDGSTPTAWQVKSDGSYHLVLNPGMYTLTFALGDKTVEKQVTVGADRVDLDVQL